MSSSQDYRLKKTLFKPFSVNQPSSAFDTLSFDQNIDAPTPRSMSTGLNPSLSILSRMPPRKRWKKIRLCIYAGVLSAGILLTLAPYVMAQDNATPEKINIYRSIENHPTVAAIRSQVCQARSQIDQSRAVLRPQFTGQITGGSSLKSNIETQETYQRRFDNTEIDAVLTLRQILYDWGAAQSDVQIAENNRSSALLGVQIEQDQVAGNILSLYLNHQELVKQNRIRQKNFNDLKTYADRLEDSVRAGVGRISDLRSIKIMLLDAEIAQDQIQKQIELIEREINEQFQITFTDVIPLMATYQANKPDHIPQIDIKLLKEVQRLDYDFASSQLELEALKAERKPNLSAVMDTTFFDVDHYADEYEVAGRLQLSFPLYDGGSNKAQQNEAQWRSRGITSQKEDTIRQHQSQIGQILNQLAVLDEEIVKNNDKIIEVNQQIETAQARQGLVENNPLQMAQLITQRAELLSTEQRLKKDRDVNFLQGIFFTDQLGEILNLNEGGVSC